MTTFLIIIAGLALVGALWVGWVSRRRTTLPRQWEATQISADDVRNLWHKHD